jgi:hypothetical protein
VILANGQAEYFCKGGLDDPNQIESTAEISFYAQTIGAGDVAAADLRHALQHGLFRRAHRVGRSDMHPDPVEPQPEQALLFVRRVEQLGQ